MSRAYTKNGNATRSHMVPDNSVSGGEHNSLAPLKTIPIVGIPDLPVFATTQVAGATVMSKKPIDRTLRPNFLLHVEDAYGLIISDNAMDPEAKNGSTVLVHPHLPARNGDTCVFQSEPHSDISVVVRQLVRSNERTWRVHQHKPAKDYDLKKSDWPVCHLVVGNFSRR